MLISSAQRLQAARELATLRQTVPVSDRVIAHRLRLTVNQLRDVLAMSALDPRETRRVRDFLVALARSRV